MSRAAVLNRTQNGIAQRGLPPRPPFPNAPELKTHAPTPTPWPLEETDIDLPDDPPPPPLPAWAEDPLYLGSVTVTERGVVGPVSLDVLLTTDGCHLELGPFGLDRDALRRLLRLCQVLSALIGHDRRPATRTCADLARGGLGEGEGRP